MKTRPQGRCRGPWNADPRCWACNYSGSNPRLSDATKYLNQSFSLSRMMRYEELVEIAEGRDQFSINGLWRALPHHGPSDYSLAKNVVWDLHFHRLSRPALVSTNGIVRAWEWALPIQQA